ncbi:MAG: cysteine--tRNA ligase, partial [Gammaproteobacteria bacterium]|nr:cysteine--tRNA ligase [Gammaproteobacteria bacterium]
MLKLFNSLSKQKEIFKPLIDGHISMYVCGVTVYDHCHLGHARCMVVFDMMTRYFRHLGYHVKLVRNITDIDDKIIRKAHELNCSFEEVSQRFIQSMQDDAKALFLQAPSIEPKATEHIEDIIKLIQILLDKHMAYLADNGDVCFAVEDFKDYGKLSRQDIDQLLAGVRVEVDAAKRSPLDFVLWKRSKTGEPSWSSPWGEGRPGWHIECSAMAMAHLGPQIDIHGGGLDLQFPHHENEIAQSEACTEKNFANYWLHVGLLQINQEKMAKSTGNFLTIKDALAKFPAEVIKLFFMSAHYRSPLNYTEDRLNEAHKGLARLYQTLKNFPSSEHELNPEWMARFDIAMNDDFNTSDALALMFELANEINRSGKIDLIASLQAMGDILGILQLD